MKRYQTGIALAVTLLVLGAGAASFAENAKEVLHHSADSTKRVSKRVWSETKTGAERVGSDVKVGAEKAGHGIEKGVHKVEKPFKKHKDQNTDASSHQ